MFNSLAMILLLLAFFTAAILNLAIARLTGTGAERNPQRGFDLLLQLAENGNALAMDMVGQMYLEGQPVAADPEQAYAWFQRAADAGNPDGMYHVGWCIENRHGVEDPAVEWYEKAAQAGQEDAIRRLGELRSGN